VANRKANCRGCDTQIIWVKNENGKAEPFDAKTCRVMQSPGKDYKVYTDASITIEPPQTNIVEAHLPHFVTCPKAGDFKKGKKT